MDIKDAKIGQTITATPATEYEEWAVIAIEYSTGMIQAELIDDDPSCCDQHFITQWFRAVDIEPV